MTSTEALFCGSEDFAFFSTCFLNTILIPLNALFILAFGLARIRYVKNHNDESLNFDNYQKTQIFLGIGLTLFPIIRSFLYILVRDLHYPISGNIGDFFLCFSWGFCLYVLTSEAEKGYRRGGWIQFFLVSSFFLISFQIRNAIGGDLINLGISILEFIFSFFITTLGLYFNDETIIYSRIGSSETEEEEMTPSPEPFSSIYSKLTFSWLNSILEIGIKRPLERFDLYRIPIFYEAEKVSKNFDVIWREELKKPKPKMARALWNFVKIPFLIAGAFKIVQDILLFAGPYFLKLLVQYVQDPNPNPWYGMALVAGVGISAAIQSLVLHQYFWKAYLVGMSARAAIVTLVYEKSFFLGTKEKSTGELTNLQSVDSQRLQDLFPYLHMLWSSIFQVTVSLIFLWQLLGPSALAGIGVMILVQPLNFWMGKKTMEYQKELMKNRDNRIKVINEVINGIRVVKFFAWEEPYAEKITDIREDELSTFRKSIYLRSFMVFFWGSTPTLVALATFATYSLTGHQLTAEIAFASVVLFNIIRFPLNILPMVFSSLGEAWASMIRLEDYFLSQELDQNAVCRDPVKDNFPIRIENGTFQWNQSQNENSDIVLSNTLNDINFVVEKGTITAVVGTVGSGKSSLLATILGEIPKISGKVNAYGTIAYVPQQAWIQNETVRENILFGKPFDEQKYKETIRVCELTSDLEQLIDGDRTEIGERGINLSGGQKQRVSLARAVYQDTDIYLLDDCLSAVDAHVGKKIFENCINGTLKNKTRLLVTHQLQFVSQTTQIIMLKDGYISEKGSYQDLMERDSEFSKLINTHIFEKKKEEVDEVNQEEEKKKEEKTEAKSGKLMTTEEKEIGNVDKEVYKTYLLSLGGWLTAIVLLIFFCMEQTAKLSSDFWLAKWSGEMDPNTKFFLGIYTLLNLLNAGIIYLRSLGIFLAGINASRKLHYNMLMKILKAPTSFFDTTPVGRILNRFSKDTQQVDEVLPRTLSMFLSTLLSAFFAILAIGIVTPFSLILIPPLGYIYLKIKDYYLTSSREFKRLDSVSKSPIYAQFAETLHGLSTIRSYQRQNDFIKRNNERLDNNQAAYYALTAANRWLGVRIELLGTGVILTAALFIVLSHGSISPGLAGLSLSYSLTLTGTLNWLTRMMTDLENNMVSVERVKEYTNVPQEKEGDDRNVRKNWPEKGEIEMKDIKLRYREGLDLVLKGLSMKIQSGERVGVIGRTGAGKSSLMLALFRMVELASGSITIDNIDISEIKLETLRKNISIIPQDPTLFTGTIRDNLDPFHQTSDEVIWSALKSVHLKEFVSNMDQKLDSEVKEYGENFSVGQRQLFCLARALIKKSKILVMDEATAAVDFETDSLIQTTIRKEFGQVTILTIAHRINTILDYDKIAVMDDGLLKEFDSPNVLLKNPNGLFTKLTKQSHVNVTHQINENQLLEE